MVCHKFLGMIADYQLSSRMKPDERKYSGQFRRNQGAGGAKQLSEMRNWRRNSALPTSKFESGTATAK